MAVLNRAYFNGYNGSHFYIELVGDILSRDIERNQSVVRYSLYFGSQDGYSGGGATSNGYIIDSWVGSTSYIGANTRNLIGYRDVTYVHNADGTLTVSYNASLSTSWGGVGGASLSGTWTLPKIDRFPILINGMNFNDEQDVVYNISSFNTFPIRVKLEAGGDVNLITRDLPASFTGEYTLELTAQERTTLRTLCANSKTLPVVETVCAMDGDTELNASFQSYTMTIVNAEPTFTYTMAETDTNVISFLGSSSANSLVDNVSVARIVVSPTAYKQATIVGVNIINGGVTYSDTTSPYQIDIPVTDNIFTINVIDSRGYTTTIVDSNRTLMAYERLKINSYSFKRESPISSNVILNFDCLYYSTIGNEPNTPIVKWQLDSGSLVTVPSTYYSIDSTNHKLTITNYELTNVLNYQTPGQFTIYVMDILTSAQDTGENGKVLKGVPTYDVGEHDLQVNGTLYVADTNRNNAVDVMDEIDDKQPKYNLVTNSSAVKTGRKIDGKDEYVKRFRASIYDGLQIAHGLSNFKITYVSAFIDNTYDGAYRPIPLTTGSTYYVYQINNTYIEYYQSFNLTGNIEIELRYILNN